MRTRDINVRAAMPRDAEAIARVYVESWRDAYPGILPAKLLLTLTVPGQAARWKSAIAAKGREGVLVAEREGDGVIGMTSFGPARDAGLGFDSEIYTLYVHPLTTGEGVGRTLLAGGFDALARRGHAGCIIWAHAKNPARFFYEAMGGKLVAERDARLMGMQVPEAAFGWPALVLAKPNAPARG